MLLKTIVGTMIGAALGLLYYKLVGCHSDSCPITAKPHRTALYGAILGFMISSSF